VTARPQPPIGDYALLSDSQGSALVNRDGSIDWACLPRFDSSSTFARLLDPNGGHWLLRPTGEASVSRAYVDSTMVLRTVFTTARGSVAVTDALPFLPTARGHGIGQRSPHSIMRLVEGLTGSVELESEVAPRAEYGLTEPRWQPVHGGAIGRGGPALFVLSCEAPIVIDGATVRSRFTVQAGERVGFALRVGESDEARLVPWNTRQIRAWIFGTIRGWQSWSTMHQTYDGPYADLVHHSGRVLKALTYTPTGAIVAAPTTSLPEAIGGERNWDYRYSWVRDASFTLAALWIAACPDEVADFFGFFAHAAGGTERRAEPIQIMYGIGGENRLEEQELDHLRGYRDSGPVRIGNAAWRQSQLDVYGEFLDAASVYAERIASLDETVVTFLIELANSAADRWEEPDQGIWELRGEPRHHLYSKLMCWVALDRACTLADALHATDHLERWKHERERIRTAILERGWSDTANAFTQSWGADDLDASALMIPIVGFLPGDDSRVVATIAAIRAGLSDEHGLVYRYRADDGLAGGEATFGICTYWLAQALALSDDLPAARTVFELVTSYANDVGLLAEEVDGATGELLGNFPQAFTHIGLINAASAIADAERRASDTSGSVG
jgi:GH15 family glucan-1,4-alpha-glucosidase